MSIEKTQQNIPKGWNHSNLGEVAKIYDGTHQTPDYVEDGVPFYSVEHLTANDFNVTKYIAEDVYIAESARVKIEKGDVLMSRIGDIGTARYVDWEARASFYVTLALLKIKDTNLVNARFLSHLINSYEFKRELWKRTLHVAFPNKINLGDINECAFGLPPKPEQDRIVAVLETWDRAIEKLKRKIEIKKEVKKGLMQSIMSGRLRIGGFSDEWRVLPLSNLCHITTGKKDVNEGNPKGAYPFFTCAREHTYSDAYSFDTEAILIAGNADVGHCKYYKGKFEAYQRTYVLSDFEKVDAKYLFLFLSHYFKNHVESLKQIGAMSYIKLPMLRDFLVKLPDKDEQIAIANLLTTASEELDKLEEKLLKLEDQKRYLLNNLITGTIRTPETLSTSK